MPSLSVVPRLHQVATDIAARGLDIPDVQLVLQNGLPSNKEFYVHRAGRTARAGKAGRCVVLYREKERQDVGALGRELGVHFSFQAPPAVNVSRAATHEQHAAYSTQHSTAQSISMSGHPLPNALQTTESMECCYMAWWPEGSVLLSMTALVSYSARPISRATIIHQRHQQPHPASKPAVHAVAHLPRALALCAVHLSRVSATLPSTASLAT